MRRTTLQFVSLSVLVAFIGFGCNTDDPAKPDNPNSGNGGFQIIPPGGSGGGGGAGGTGGDGEGGAGGAPQIQFEIDAVHPKSGSVEGGTRVTITGRGFVASIPDGVSDTSTRVIFGDNPSIDVRVVDDSTIHATAPVGVEGETDVIVRNASGEKVCAGCFRYLPPLFLDTIAPNAGPLEGGSRITLRGEGLTEETVVLFGSRAGLDPSVNEDGSLSVTLPPGDLAGLVDVRAFSEGRQSLLRRAFRYRGELRIDAIEPPLSPVAGGDTVVIRGQGFSTSTKISFGGVEAFAQLRESGLEVTVPPGAGPGAIVVEAHDEASQASFPFAYFDPNDPSFAFYGLSPDRGPALGGTEVSLLGSGFDAGGLVAYFDGIPADEIVVLGPNLALATVPEGAAGPVDVRVRTTEGMETLEDAFLYLRPLEISSVEPATGPVEGGTPIALLGFGFPENPLVYVGALPATEVVRVSEARIEAVTPQGSDGGAPIRVIDADDPTHRVTLHDGFTYEGPLSLAIVDPPTGARAGGTRVFVRGTGFRGDMQVFFGENEAEEVVIADPFTLEVITPRGNIGLVDVQVEREDGESAVLEGAFTYYNPSSGYGGSSGGPLNGILNVTAVAGSGPNQNGPIEGCNVYVGTDESSRIVKQTDERGEVTFSSPSLVKGVTLTVSCVDYEIATVANQVSENVTVILDFNGPGEPSEPDDPPEIKPSILAGHIYGFNLPPSRTLAANEEAIARVSVAYQNIYRAPPFANPMQVLEVRQEGGPFTFQFRGSAYLTVYAVFGIRNVDTNAFEPLLMGYSRGITVPFEGRVLDVEVILDTRLDREVPLEIIDPPWGIPGSVLVTAYLDLGGEGIIPVGETFNSDHPNQALLTHMPRVSGESLIFHAFGHTAGRQPWSFTYRRQGGDVTQGVTIGPLMGPTSITQPPLVPNGNTWVGEFKGTFEWNIEPSGQEPDVIFINVFTPEAPPFIPEPIPHWHTVLPGSERRVTIPDAVRAELRAKLGGNPVFVTFITGSQPKFEFPEWNYSNIGLASFTSFTYHSFWIVP